MKITRAEILEKGSIELQVKVAGIVQRQIFNVKKEMTGFGEVNFLVTTANIPAVELARFSKELDFPVKSPRLTVFPPGKSVKDFLILSKS